MAHQLLHNFRAYVSQHQLFTKTDNLLLACSSGLDSTVLAHLLHAEGYQFTLAHMNFRLRGEASDEDAKFVANLARTLDAKSVEKAVDTYTAANPGESTQMVARRLRYNWFERLLDEYNYDIVLTAHHADDNLETALINLIRGTGVKGLAGISPTQRYIRRPLLSADRAMILDYAKQNNIDWREDASNATNDYLRNRLRHHLTPLLKDDFGLSTQSWNRTAAYLRAGVNIYEAGLDTLEQANCRREDDRWIVNRDGWPINTLDTFLHERATAYGFTEEQLRQVLSVAGQRRLESPTAYVNVFPEQLVFIFKTTAPVAALPALVVNQLPYTSKSAGHFRFRMEIVARPDQLHEPGVHFLSLPQLPLHLRPRRKGDRLQPLGMAGHKSVKADMIDRKIPAWHRDRIYLLTDAEGRILAVPGVCVTEAGKVRAGDEEVLKISWELGEIV